MPHVVIFDCEFLVSAGAHTRFWCGPHDPDPIVAQIGAVKLDLSGDFSLGATHRSFVTPVDRFGVSIALDPAFSQLTGISQAQMDANGVPLEQALTDLADFADGAAFWSWGKDEFNLIAISCFVAGIAPPLPADRFGNATQLLLTAGMPLDEIHKTRSHTLLAALDLPPPDGTAHDALTDALHVAIAVQHLLREGRLEPRDLVLSN